MNNCGAKVWFVPDGYYPEFSTGKFPSHEAICILNPGDRDAHIAITLYFEEREKMDGFQAVCPAERTYHLRMDQIQSGKGEKVPIGVPYAMMICSDEKVIVQYSRMDTTQSEMALMTTIAYPMVD